jgi:hypothetical protein
MPILNTIVVKYQHAWTKDIYITCFVAASDDSHNTTAVDNLRHAVTEPHDWNMVETTITPNPD